MGASLLYKLLLPVQNSHTNKFAKCYELRFCFVSTQCIIPLPYSLRFLLLNYFESHLIYARHSSGVTLNIRNIISSSKGVFIQTHYIANEITIQKLLLSSQYYVLCTTFYFTVSTKATHCSGAY